MIREVLKARLHAPVVFPSHKYKRVCLFDFAGERLHGWWCGAWSEFLVHSIEHRQAYDLGVDQLHIDVARTKSRDNEICQSYAQSIAAIGPVENKNSSSHEISNSYRERISSEPHERQRSRENQSQFCDHGQ